jgi:hypothetical protein
MRRASRSCTVLSVAVLAAPILVSGVLMAEAAPPGANPPAFNKTPIQVNPNVFRPDLAARLTITKSIVAGNGVIAMHGLVCNQGTRDYAVPPAAPVDSEYMVYTRHPPHTWAQEANVKLLGHKSIGTKVQVGADHCVAHNLTLSIPNVARFVVAGQMYPHLPGERLAEKQLVFRLMKNYPNGDNFTASEDANPENNGATIEFQYTEKAP